MDRIEKAIFYNMCMICDGRGNVLVQDRVKSWNGIAFPGGHVEFEESFVDSTIREIKEETGLIISNLNLVGVKQWFNKETGRNVCFLYKTNSFKGELLEETEEGRNFWIPLNRINEMNIASGFDLMLEVFENNNLSEFYHNRDKKTDFIK